MRILFVGLAHDYGDPARGPSFEEMNFRSALDGMGHEVLPFDFAAEERRTSREEMNVSLVRQAAEFEPDLVFFFLWEEQITPETVREVGRVAGAPTMNWFADDHWRFDGFSRRYATALDWVITTDHAAPQRYRDVGQPNVILSQWACNRYAYGRTGTAVEHDVSFVGLPHGDREQVIGRLRDAGIDVATFGLGWPAGRLGHADMVRTFGASRINLNLSNSSLPPQTLRARLGAIVRRLDRSPRPPQIKGRTFEVPGSGGFLLAERVPHLEEYFELGREIGVFDGEADLIEQIRYWLDHEEERREVADAGYRRVLAEHTYDHRFEAIFRQAGLG